MLGARVRQRGETGPLSMVRADSDHPCPSRALPDEPIRLRHKALDGVQAGLHARWRVVSLAGCGRGAPPQNTRPMQACATAKGAKAALHPLRSSRPVTHTFSTTSMVVVFFRPLKRWRASLEWAVSAAMARAVSACSLSAQRPQPQPQAAAAAAAGAGGRLTLTDSPSSSSSLISALTRLSLAMRFCACGRGGGGGDVAAAENAKWRRHLIAPSAPRGPLWGPAAAWRALLWGRAPRRRSLWGQWHRPSPAAAV